MSRLQLALNVSDLEASVAFYSRLLGVEPAKTKAGYANFAVANPPLKLVLIENADAPGGSINHLGVEVASTADVDGEQSRLAGLGLASVDERGTTCCFARQDKFWVENTPDGERWEVYTVLSDADVMHGEPADGAACCAADASTDDVPVPVTAGAATAAACC